MKLISIIFFPLLKGVEVFSSDHVCAI